MHAHSKKIFGMYSFRITSIILIAVLCACNSLEQSVPLSIEKVPDERVLVRTTTYDRNVSSSSWEKIGSWMGSITIPIDDFNIEVPVQFCRWEMEDRFEKVEEKTYHIYDGVTGKYKGKDIVKRVIDTWTRKTQKITKGIINNCSNPN